MRKAAFLAVLVLATLALLVTFSPPSMAAPPASSAKVNLPHTENGAPLCVNYWPDGEYLGVLWKFAPKDASPEAINALYRAGMIELATQHGRWDLVDKLMRAEVNVHFVKDKAAFEAEAGFAPPESPLMSTAAVESVLAPSPEVTLVEDPGYSTDVTRRSPPGRGIPCVCMTHVCGADVCGKFYCGGGCGGCGFCG